MKRLYWHSVHGLRATEYHAYDPDKDGYIASSDQAGALPLHAKLHVIGDLSREVLFAVPPFVEIVDHWGADREHCPGCNAIAAAL